MATELCPSTKNELGKGTLPTHVEERLLADGFIFACMLPTKGFKSMLVCKRSIADAVTDGELDDPRLYPSMSEPAQV
jgi:hypothetical protein